MQSIPTGGVNNTVQVGSGEVPQGPRCTILLFLGTLVIKYNVNSSVWWSPNYTTDFFIVKIFIHRWCTAGFHSDSRFAPSRAGQNRARHPSKCKATAGISSDGLQRVVHEREHLRSMRTVNLVESHWPERAI